VKVIGKHSSSQTKLRIIGPSKEEVQINQKNKDSDCMNVLIQVIPATWCAREDALVNTAPAKPNSEPLAL
jgi:hypothetical protein